MMLPWLILLPFFGGILSWMIERFSKKFSTYIVFIAIILGLVFSISLFLNENVFIFKNNFFSNIPKWKTYFSIPWIPYLGINITLNIDNLSMLMIITTFIISCFSILSSWNDIRLDRGKYYFYLMCIISGSIGIFMALDLFLFFFFWEVTLIPTYFLILFWGNKYSKEHLRLNAANKFFIYTQLGGLAMLMSISALALIHYQSTGNLSFCYNDLLGTKVPLFIQCLLMLGFFLALAIKIPLIPFHGWLPDAQEQSPLSGSVDISNFTIKTATYSLLRFVLPLFPEASNKFIPVVMMLSILNIFYGSFLAFKQVNMKRLIAYNTLSHSGFITIAIYSGSLISYQGAIFQMISSMFSGTALIIISSQLFKQFKTFNIYKIGNIQEKIAWIPGLLLFFSFATLGVPGTGNFVGELLILLGTFEKFKILPSVMVIGIFFSSIYVLHIIQKIFYGDKNEKKVIKEVDSRKIFSLFALALLLLFLGLYPQFILNISKNIVKLSYNTF